MDAGMQIVVTGASGHVGTNLIPLLRATGHRVRALVHGKDRGGLVRHDDALHPPVEEVEGDVLDPVSLRSAFAGADVVYHLAAFISISGSHDGKVERINVDGVRNVAEAALAAGVRRLVHCSSVHAFNLYAGRALDETKPRAEGPPCAPYDRSKYAGERALREVIANGLDATIVNPTGIIGPFDYIPSRTGRTFVDLSHGRILAMPTGGFDFVDVRDVADALVAAATHGRTGENYLLPGTFVSARRLAIAWSKQAGVAAPRFTLPMALVRLAVPFAALAAKLTGEEPKVTHEALDTLDSRARVSGDKAAAELGYKRRSLDETLRDTHAWLVEAGRVPPRAGPRLLAAQ